MSRLRQGLKSRYLITHPIRTHQLGEAFKQRGSVFLDQEIQALISWSPKSACTQVLMWHLQSLGLLQEARDQFPWLHNYRRAVLYRSNNRVAAQSSLYLSGPKRWQYIKVVRDPVKRCFSSYRHALGTGYADRDMSEVLAQPICHQEGFSLKTFLTYLSQVDLTNTNPHHQLQSCRWDKQNWKAVFLIHIDEFDLAGCLSFIDNLTGRPCAFADPMVVKAIHSDQHRYATPLQRVESTSEAWTIPLTKEDTRRWPQSALLHSGEAIALARQLYQSDYEMIAALRSKSQRFPDSLRR